MHQNVACRPPLCFSYSVQSRVLLRPVIVTACAAILRGKAEDLSNANVLLLAALKTHTDKQRNQTGQTLDGTSLNMGPPGDRTRHTSTDRTGDLRWMVDLS